ncbi:MAG TPA: hypothetical protein VGW10_04915 [Solirubrobacteraceae bacterium]|nr:hypothetical protein [Solirubrobacteraceae bacterium]
MPGSRPLAIAALGMAIGLAGDACHVVSGTTRYEPSWVPTIWQSKVWFPILVGSAVLLAAWAGRRAGLPAARVRRRSDVVAGAGVVLALYALTAALRGQPETVSVLLTAGIAVAVWAWWDPSPGALAIAGGAAVAGPLAEILLVEAGAAAYASDADGLGGVAPWLPCLYFAAGAVASGLWDAIGRSDKTGASA